MTGTVFRQGATALITGAGGGIGFAIAQLCRSHDMNLILTDIHADNLAKVHTLLGDTEKAKTMTHVMDVSDPSSWEFLRDHVADHFPGGVDLLMLNAGTSLKAEDAANPWQDLMYFQKTFATNLKGVLNGISTFLPSITATASQRPKAIVITGSKQGITNPPGSKNPAYNASKAAVKSIAEHLAHDLRSGNATQNIQVHLLIPGLTFTGMTGSGGPVHDDVASVAKPKSSWTPRQVATYMYEKMLEGKFYIVCPDGEVSESLDKARIAWAAGDIIEGRPPLSRWHKQWQDSASEQINKDAEAREA